MVQKRLAIVLIALCCCCRLSAQQRIGHYLAYGRENGLPQLSYHEVFESSNGLIWAGSNSGLFQFDGKRFRPFYSFYNNHNSLSDNNIVDFEEDDNGNLWIAGFFSGLTKYNLQTGRFRQYKKLKADKTSTFQLFDLFKDKKGTIWIATAGRGLAEYLPEKDTFRFYYPEPGKATDASKYGENFISGIKEDKTNPDQLWVSAFNGLYLFNKRTGVFTLFQLASMKPGLTEAFISMESNGDQIFLGTWFQGLVVFDIKTQAFRRIPYEITGKPRFEYCILDLQAVNDSLVYLAAINDGLLVYHTKSGTVTPELQTKDIGYLHTEINIQRVSFTPHMGLVAGGNSMLYQAHPSYNRYSQVIPYGLPKSYPREFTRFTGIAEDVKRNGVWMSADNFSGLLFFSQGFKTKQIYRAGDPENKWFEDVAVDGSGKVWAADGTGYVLQLKEDKGLFVKDTPVVLLQQASQNRVRDLQTDAAGDVWMAGEVETYCVNGKTGAITRYTYPSESTNLLSKEKIRFFSVATDSYNNAWMSSNIGLLKMDKQKGKTVYFGDSLGPGRKLANRLIKSMTIDREDRIWIGYFNEGIQVVNSRRLEIEKSFTTRNGLPSMEVNYMAADHQNNIYACTHSGLAVYRPASQSWLIVNGQDGLKSDYLDMPVAITQKNEMILEQRDGFLYLPLDSVYEHNSGKTVSHISAVRVNDKEWEGGLLPDYGQSISLPSSANDITIEFSVMNWYFPLRTQYFYRVDGIHPSGEWLRQEEARISLTGLSSGTYTFRFYGVTALGVRTKERILKITIQPPFYKTTWFSILVLSCIGGILFGVYRYRINQLKRFYRMRNSISRDLHDDIGASLSNINILTELAKRYAGNETRSKEYLEKAGEDIQRVSESLSDIVWNINPRYDELESLFIRMRRYAADMMDGKNIVYEISISPQAEKVQLSMDRRRNLYLIFKECINNLVKYSGATKARVLLETTGTQVVLEISDNGIGFETGAVRQGNGLVNMEKRAAEMGAEFVLESEPGRGTTVRLQLPVK